MNNLSWAIAASISVSLISLIGIFSLMIKEDWLKSFLIIVIGFSAGGLIGGAFFHLLPEALHETDAQIVSIYIVMGFIAFLLLEKYLHWRHCHEGVCSVHAFTYLNLIGDGIHNFTDGLVIGTSFILDIHFGLITSLVIILHEIPQEIGDFGVLLYGGFSKYKALFCNFITALTCIAGTIIGYILTEKIGDFSAFLLSFTAGGFIYIAACDLVPELHKQQGFRKGAESLVSFLSGIVFILLARSIHTH